MLLELRQEDASNNPRKEKADRMKARYLSLSLSHFIMTMDNNRKGNEDYNLQNHENMPR